jgi:dihydrofolate synthase/folylpolyglutamate synthase
MSYASAIEKLGALSPELHSKPGQTRRKFSLDEMRVLVGALGNPEVRFRSVLIAGTNGKGSTAATLASVLQASGIRTGLYTSPHLSRINERIRVNGIEIEDQALGDLYFRVESAAKDLVQGGLLPQTPSFFEFITAMGFLYFAEAGVEVAVLEVGMGGRLDATNVVEPLLSVITDISLDHTEWLGSTISAIAREKAGILRKNGTLITLAQHPEANQTLGEVAAELGVCGVNAGAYMPMGAIAREGSYQVEVLGEVIEIASPLGGVHQHRNIALALAAAVELRDKFGFPITAPVIAEGVRGTRWPGRLERLEVNGVSWLLDVAHNAAGAWALRAGVGGSGLGERHPKVLIFSCLRDKPLQEMAQVLFPEFDLVIVAPIASPRASSIADLLKAAEGVGCAAIAAGSVTEALSCASRECADGVVVVSGSVYLVGEARSILIAEKGPSLEP